MHRPLRCCALLLLLAAPASWADDNRIAKISVDEGPNNTVVTIEGSATPTFTVFKLLDPVRLLIDVVGGDITSVATTMQVRNGVIHDIETVRFASSGQKVGRIVIGFDRDAPYTVKADGTRIRVVVDGTDRRSPSIESEKEVQKRIQAVIESEKALKAELGQAKDRELKLRATHEATIADQKRLAEALATSKADVARLKLALEARTTDVAKDADAARLAEKRLLEEQKRLAQSEVDALKREKLRASEEKAAVDAALATAEARRTALEKALAAEEARRKAAEQARLEEEELVRSVRKAREAEEKRLAEAKKLGVVQGDREVAMNDVRKAADAYRGRAEKAEAELEAARTALAKARSDRTDGAKVGALQDALERKEREHKATLADLDRARKAAEAKATELQRAWELAKAELATAEKRAERESTAKDAAVARERAAKEAALAKAKAKGDAVAELEKREQERVKAEKIAEDVATARAVLAEQLKLIASRKADLAEAQKALAAERHALDEVVKARARAKSDVEAAAKAKGALDQAIQARSTEIARLEGRLQKAAASRGTLDRDLAKQEQAVLAVGARLAREKEDLAAVLAQKSLFKKEINALKAEVGKSRAELSAIEKVLAKDKDEVKRLAAERLATEKRVQTLTADLARLERGIHDGGDRLALQRLLDERKAEIVTLKRSLDNAKSEGGAERLAQEKRLEAALATARAEAAKTKEGREKIAALEKFLAAQKAALKNAETGQIASSADKKAAEKRLAQREAQVKELEAALGAATAQKREAVDLARLKDKELKHALAQATKESGKTQKDAAKAIAAAKTELATATARLAKIESHLKEATALQLATEKKLGVAQHDLTTERHQHADTRKELARTAEQRAAALAAAEKLDKALGTARAELAESRQRIQGLSARQTAADREIARLERSLEQARAQGGNAGSAAKALEAELAKARSERKAAEEALAADRARSARQVAEAKSALDKAEQRRKALEGELETASAKLSDVIARERKATAAAQTAVKAERARHEKVLADKLAAIAALENELRTKDASATAAAELARLAERATALATEAAEAKKSLAKAARDANKLRTDRDKARAETARLRTELTAARSKGSERKDLAEALAASEKAKARLEALLATAAQERKKDRAEAHASVKALETRRSELEKQLATDRAMRVAVEADLAQARKGLGSATVSQAQLTALEAERDRLTKALATRDATVAGLERELVKARAVADVQTELARALADVAEAKKETSAVKAELAKAAARLEALQHDKQAAEREVARLQKAVALAPRGDDAALRRELESARGQVAQLERQLSTVKDSSRELESLKTKLGEANDRIASLVQKNVDATERVTSLEAAVAAAKRSGQPDSALQRDLAEARTQLAALGKALDTERQARHDEKAQASAQIRDLESRKTTLERELSERRAEAARMAAKDAGAERAALERAVADKTEAIGRLEKSLSEARAREGAAAELESRLVEARDAERKALAKADDAERRAKSAESQLGEVKARVAVLEKGKAEADAEAQRLATALKDREKPATKDIATKDAAKETSKLTRITNVAFNEKNNVSRLEIELDGSDATYEVVEKTDQRIVLVVDKARIPKVLERRLDVSDFYGPVRMVSTYADPQDESKVRVVVDLAESVRNTLAKKGNRLVWEFMNGERVHSGTAVAKADTKSDTRAERPGKAKTREPWTKEPNVRYEPTAVGGDQTGPTGGGGVNMPGGGTDFGVLDPFPKRAQKRKYKGRKINLTIKDADIQQVLTFLAREGEVNIIASENVQGAVTVHLKDVPWDLALDMILKSKGLDYVVEDGVYRVAPVDVIQKEFDQELEKRKKLTELKRLVVKLVTVNYADADNLKARLKDILSPKGTIDTDVRTNTLIIKDIEEHVMAAEDLARRLDTQTPQVLIEARIVEASSNFAQDVGIQWGGNYTASPAFGNETGLVFPGILGLSGAADDVNAPSTGLLDPTPGYAVNLPAAVGGGKGGALGLTLGTLTGSGSISLRLSAAEERGTVKIISSPRIATLDNTEATINQGISIPISVVSSLGVNTQFFNASLELRVKPHVTQDGHVAMKIDITKNEPNFSQTAAAGNPTIERKEAHTQLLVKDGDTAVMGGIFTRNSSQSFKKVPGLGDIPFLGWLFKSRVSTDKRTELILFITPRIINRAAARVRVD